MAGRDASDAHNKTGQWRTTQNRSVANRIPLRPTCGATRHPERGIYLVAVPKELGSAWELMKAIKRTIDPKNIMNPGER